ncbi:hypothetical protein [Pararhodospirillum photometricum]|uniref:Uncharacterized protein n=1 Tax=Pararhodospirillum photometricum DSM 122 TaxID=1150469 RepID=H6SPX0_PARPM|nr:hypothetical protein [Pararhodospirillum photometricum]CCG07240.1 unnamed protein product [Pararhodospirillum photometricum DSM 122]
MKQAAVRVHRDSGVGAPSRERGGAKRSLWPDPYPGTEEPRLRDLFEDDVMRSLMVSDRVAHESLASLIQDTRGRLGL